MARLRLGPMVAGAMLLGGLWFLLMAPVSGAERSVRIDNAASVNVDFSALTMAFGSVPLGTSVDSTNGTGGSDTTTNKSILITNNSGTGGPSGRVGLLTLDYTDTIPGARCPTNQGDWVPDSTNLEANIGVDEFVMYGVLSSTDLTGKVVIPAAGGLVSLTWTGNWADKGTQVLDLQLFMPASVSTGSASCTIALTITATVP